MKGPRRHGTGLDDAFAHNTRPGEVDTMSVNTVLGPVPAAGLGRTLMHEHLLADRFRVPGKDD